MISILIMAGGIGERFWPLSSKEKPKQALSIFTGKSLIRETVDRVLGLVDISNIFIATNKIQEDIIKANIPELPISNLILEPQFKDTAAAIGYGSQVINKKYPNSTICVLASDHLIKDVSLFLKYIEKANDLAQKGEIITFGIRPKNPETGYGYIETKNVRMGYPSKVISFREKPDYSTAIDYLEKGNYLWNSGMFIFTYSTIIENFKQYSPNHYQILQDLERKEISIEKAFELFPKVSIDYAIMEKSNDVSVIPSDFGWNDVGSFNAFDELFDKNENGTVDKSGTLIEVDSYRNIIINSGKTIALIGIEDTIVVETNEAILITKKNESQRIKEVIKRLTK